MTAAPPSGGPDAGTFGFPTIRTEVKDAGPDIADRLTDRYNYFQQIGAQPAARRLRLLDSGCRTLTPDAIDRVVDPERTVEEVDEIERMRAPWSRNPQWLSQARNALALCPLVLTWLALAFSTIAYQQQLVADPRLVAQPFLYLWQQRFGGRLVFFCPDFATTALLDFLLLIAILVLTLRSGGAESRFALARAKLANDLDSTLDALRTALADRIVPTDNPRNWADAVRQVIDAAMRETKEMANANRLVLQQMQSALARFETSGHQFMEKLAHEQSQMIANASAQLQAMVAQTKSAQDHIAELNQRALNEATAKMKQSRDEIAKFIQELAQQSRGVLETLQDQASKDLTQLGREASKIIQGAGESMGALSVELPRHIQQLGEDVAQYRHSATLFADKVTELGSSAATLTASAQRFAQSGGSIDDTLKRLEQSQAANAGQIAGAAADLQRAAQATQILATQMASDLSPRLNEAAVNAAQAGHTLAGVNSQIGAAAALIQQAVQRLEKDLAYGIPVRLPLPWPFRRKQHTGTV